MRLRALIAAAFLTLVCAPAFAQGVNRICVESTGSNGSNNCVDVSAANPFPVTGGGGGGGTAIAPVVAGAGVSSSVLKASAGNLSSVYASCSAQCWLMVFNATSAPSNGATTSGIAASNMQECVPIAAGGVGSINRNSPEIFSTGITAVISSTACATLTLSTVGFINGSVQ